MNTFRSAVAILAGLGVIALVTELLETTLVYAVAGGQVSDLSAYFAIRNQPGILGAKLVYSTLAAILGGFVTAKVSGRQEMRHATVTATIKTLALIWGFTADEYAAFTPAWMRVALVLLTPPGIMAGAAIRARAATTEVGAGFSRPDQPDQEKS